MVSSKKINEKFISGGIWRYLAVSGGFAAVLQQNQIINEMRLQWYVRGLNLMEPIRVK
jgi:hypothetical protein